jgi:hypothetical protein
MRVGRAVDDFQIDPGQCEEGDSNPHFFRNQILSLARLPVPPSSRDEVSTTYDFEAQASTSCVATA